jgi:SAM-dependent methyltransferase
LPERPNLLALPARTARTPDCVFVATPEHMLDVLLKTARVSNDDLVYDLGCGDGRIVIAAAARCGARGVGVDIDPNRIAEATANARCAGVTDRTTFVEADLFEIDLSDATVVTVYLLPALNLRLRPKLLTELRTGARLVSHGFDMGDWQPLETVEFAGRVLYSWIVGGCNPPVPDRDGASIRPAAGTTCCLTAPVFRAARSPD